VSYLSAPRTGSQLVVLLGVMLKNNTLPVGNPWFCKVCGYDRHVDIAHVKQVSTFPDAAPLSVINAPDNLAALCPNHHWEYDHKLLNL
jgi:predicted restriction endonuclease